MNSVKLYIFVITIWSEDINWWCLWGLSFQEEVIHSGLITTLCFSHDSLEDSCLLYFQVCLLPSHGELSSTTLRANLRTACVFAWPRMHQGLQASLLHLTPPSCHPHITVWKHLPLRASFGPRSKLPGLPHSGLPEHLAPGMALPSACWLPCRSWSAGQQRPFLIHHSFPGPH